MRLLALCLLGTLTALPTFAQAPAQIAFQGVLEDTGGPVTDPSATLTFRLYDAETDGTAVWTETHTGVVIGDGAFEVLLGTASASTGAALDALNMDRPLWLSVAVGDASAPELPRSPLAAAPYALALPGVHTAPAGASRFVGINRSTSVTPAEYFGVHADVPSGFVGMYVSGTGESAQPFYGYAPNGVNSAYHYYDPNDLQWKLNIGGVERLQVLSDATSDFVGVNVNGSGGADPFYGYGGLGSAYHYYGSGGWALNVGAADRLNVLTSGFVGVNRSTPFNQFEDFGVHTGRTSGFAGMYITGEGPGVRPYYGYSPTGTDGSASTYHYYDQTDGRWSLNVGDGAGNFGERLHVLSSGFVGINRSTPVNAFEDFGIHTERTSGFAGMYITGEGPGVLPYYGYSPEESGGASAYHYFDQSDGRWSLNVGDGAGTGGDHLHVLTNGNVGIGIVSPTERLDVDGSIRADDVILNGSDLAEHFVVREAGATVVPKPGTVLSIDPEVAGGLVVSGGAYERTVVGVVSGAGGVRPGILMSQPGTLADGDVPVAIAGRVYVRADASNGPIRPGDFLTTADRPGHAMRADDAEQARGATLGKAMSALDEGTGLVLVLVMLQ